MRGVTSAAALAMAGLLALALSGCGPADAGTAAADQFERDFAEVDGVASIETGGSNDLPFMGSVDAHVTADADLSAAQIDDLAATFSEYLRAHSSNVSWNASLTAGATTVGIGETEDLGALNLEIARDLMLTPHIRYVEVGVTYSDESVLVTIDGPEALTEGYRAAAAAVQRLGITDGRSNAHVTSDPPGFEVDDRSWDGEASQIAPALAVYQLIFDRFALIEAEATPDELSVRTAEEDDVPAVQEFIDTIPLPRGLSIDVQGGVTTVLEATPAADVVTAALADLDVSSGVRASGNNVDVSVPTAADAATVLTAIGDLPEFHDLSGFGISTTTRDFAVFDRPADFADSLSLAQAALALPSIDGIEFRDTDADAQVPTARFQFTSSDEATISAFANTMKPLLLERGWHTWINADGNVEWFSAADPLVLDDRVSGRRDADEQEFADMLVRVWDAAPR